jgi:hypothetical protein
MKKYILVITLFVSSMVLAKSKKAEPRTFDDLTYSEFLSPKKIKNFKTEKKQKISKVSDEKRKIGSIESELTNDYTAGKGFTYIRDPEVLQQLEKQGFSFYSLLSGTDTAVANLSEFKDDNYKFIVSTLNDDLTNLMAEEAKNKKFAKPGIGMAYGRRIFDSRWLQSEFANYDLIGVVNRIDRVAFDANSCGETRFIYRMAYTSKINNYSRLPFTIMIKYLNSGQAKVDWKACKNYAKAWVYPKDIANNTQLAEWLAGPGPLNSNLRNAHPFSVELNLQAMRIPSSARPDLAGHGTYLLRSFQFDDQQKIKIGVLENTPDVAKIKADKNLKKEFLEQFKDRHFVNKLSEGILKLDSKYLTTKAWSYSPYGIARLENRLFDGLITEDDLKGIKFDQSSYVKSPRAAIMRLNDLSCVGCHQARAHAGFHFLGIDKSTTHAMNSLFFEGSGHFELELRRRAQYQKRILADQWPSPKRDFSFAPGEIYSSNSHVEFSRAGFGHYCGMLDQGKEGPFSHWKCEEGLVCKEIDEAQGVRFLGKCFAKEGMTGDPTVAGKVSQSDYNSDALKPTTDLSCGKLEPKVRFISSLNKGGFPSGNCSRVTCDGIKADSPTEVCAEAAGAGFNDCIYETSKGKISFSDCLEKTMMRTGRGRCSDERSCRNDYVCARSTKNEGYCTPSYFLFQVRLDGHIDPVKGL